MTHSGPGPVGASARVRAGMGLFALGFICPVFVPLVAASPLSSEWKTFLSGALLLGLPEVFWVVAAGVMGKEGFQALKNRTFGFLREFLFPERVGRTRYRLGLVLFTLPVLLGWLIPYWPELLPGYPERPLPFVVSGDVMILVSLFVLGQGFWEKLAALYSYDREPEAETG